MQRVGGKEGRKRGEERGKGEEGIPFRRNHRKKIDKEVEGERQQ